MKKNSSQGLKKQKSWIYVFLFVLLFLGGYFLMKTNWKEAVPELPSLDMEFHKEKRSLEEIRQKLEQILPELGICSREFNHRLDPLIQLLAEQGEEGPENWSDFRGEFAYHYENLYDFSRNQEKLPRSVQESQQKIMEILQGLNEIIQGMNKN